MNEQKFNVMQNALNKLMMRKENIGDAYAHFVIVTLSDNNTKREMDTILLGLREVELPEEWKSIKTGEVKKFDDDLKTAKSFVGKVIVHGKGKVFDKVMLSILWSKAHLNIKRGDKNTGYKMVAYLSLIDMVDEELMENVRELDDEAVKYALLGGRAEVDDEKFLNPISWIGLLK